MLTLNFYWAALAQRQNPRMVHLNLFFFVWCGYFVDNKTLVGVFMKDKKIVSIRLQCILAIIPLIGWVIVFFTSAVNIGKNNRKYAFKWMAIVSVITIVALLLLALLIPVLHKIDDVGLRLFAEIFISYIVLLTMSYINVFLEKVFLKQLSNETSIDIPDDEIK